MPNNIKLVVVPFSVGADVIYDSVQRVLGLTIRQPAFDMLTNVVAQEQEKNEATKAVTKIPRFGTTCACGFIDNAITSHPNIHIEEPEDGFTRIVTLERRDTPNVVVSLVDGRVRRISTEKSRWLLMVLHVSKGFGDPVPDVVRDVVTLLGHRRVGCQYHNGERIFLKPASEIFTPSPLAQLGLIEGLYYDPRRDDAPETEDPQTRWKMRQKVVRFLNNVVGKNVLTDLVSKLLIHFHAGPTAEFPSEDELREGTDRSRFAVAINGHAGVRIKHAFVGYEEREEVEWFVSVHDPQSNYWIVFWAVSSDAGRRFVVQVAPIGEIDSSRSRALVEAVRSCPNDIAYRLLGAERNGTLCDGVGTGPELSAVLNEGSST